MRDGEHQPIPVLRPQLPDADALLPYIRRIDATRIYSNQGPLSLEFEERVCTELGLRRGSFIATANGTAALCAAVLASAGRPKEERPLALMPAFTFVATAVAVEQCGYLPYFVDIDETTWALDPHEIRRHPMLKRAGVIVPVNPLGRLQQSAAWSALSEEIGIQVVLDGAASFDLYKTTPFRQDVPIAMSFNATKSFATAEGGGIIAEEGDLAIRARRALNFGFFLTRECQSASINGKMSEYHAAIGLAELDGWNAKSAALRDVANVYQQYGKELGVSDRIVTYPEISSSYVIFAAKDVDEARRVRGALDEGLIGTRLWYGFGVHRESYFRNALRDSLPITERVAGTLLGIPVAPDLSEAAVERVVKALAMCVIRT